VVETVSVGGFRWCTEASSAQATYNVEERSGSNYGGGEGTLRSGCNTHTQKRRLSALAFWCQWRHSI